MTVLELHDKGRKALEAGRAIIKEYEGKEMPPDKDAQVDKYFSEADACDKEIKRLEKVESLEKSFAPRVTIPAPVGEMGEDHEKSARSATQKKAFFKGVIQGRATDMSDIERKSLREMTDPEGGYLCPEEWDSQIITKMANITQIEGVSTIRNITKQQLGFPTFDFSDDSEDTQEEEETTETEVTNAFGKQLFTPHKKAKIITISEEDLEDSESDIESFITSWFAQLFAQTREKNIIYGSGNGQANGIVNCTLTPIDLASGSSFTAEDPISMQMGIKAQYRNSPNCRYLFNRTYMTQIRKLRASVYNGSALVEKGDFLWQPSLQLGIPSTLCGRPVMETEYWPTVSKDGDPVGLFGDFTYEWVVNRKGFTVQRLNEKYIEKGKIGFRMIQRFDASPVLSEAFCRINRN